MNRIIKYLQINFHLYYVLVGLNIVLLLITTFFTMYFGEANSLLLFGAYYTPRVLNGEIWRLVTSAFLHAGLIHLVLNMYAFIMVGGYIEKFYGRRKLLTIYIMTALAGSVATLISDFFSVWSSGGISPLNTLSVGASGAIFGMVGVLIGNRFKRTPYEPQLNIDTQQLITIVIYNMLIGIGLNAFSGESFINIWAHVGGLVCGLLLGMLLSGINVFYVPKWKKILEKFLFVLSLIIFIVSFIAEIVFIISNFI